MHIDPAEVAVDGLQSVAMVYHDAVAIDAQGSSPYDATVIRCLDAHMLGHSEIVAKVHLMVDHFAVVDVCALVSEGGLGLGVRLASEWLGPKKLVGGFKAQVREGLVL